MKRKGNLYDQIISLENLYIADTKAMKGKKKVYGVRKHLENRDSNLLKLHNNLKDMKFKTSKYDIFTIIADSNKQRTIYRLPYYPDRIVHHAVINVLEEYWVKLFIQNTYSCIKNRGVHLAHYRIIKNLKDIEGTRYCLKMDIKKYYPSIDHDVLKTIIRKKIKDNRALSLLDNIIDSAPGVPIGNYLSQYFANIYLSYFDHYVKEVLKVKYYHRYADDLVFLHSDKSQLHEIKNKAIDYLRNELKLDVNNKTQIFPIRKRNLDFIGYVYSHTGVRLRKRIKLAMKKSIKKRSMLIEKSMAAYKGWMDHCNCVNLKRKVYESVQ